MPEHQSNYILILISVKSYRANFAPLPLAPTTTATAPLRLAMTTTRPPRFGASPQPAPFHTISRPAAWTPTCPASASATATSATSSPEPPAPTQPSARTTSRTSSCAWQVRESKKPVLVQDEMNAIMYDDLLSGAGSQMDNVSAAIWPWVLGH